MDLMCIGNSLYRRIPTSSLISDLRMALPSRVEVNFSASSWCRSMRPNLRRYSIVCRRSFSEDWVWIRKESEDSEGPDWLVICAEKSVGAEARHWNPSRVHCKYVLSSSIVSEDSVPISSNISCATRAILLWESLQYNIRTDILSDSEIWHHVYILW